jgi:hypothetical protein
LFVELSFDFSQHLESSHSVEELGRWGTLPVELVAVQRIEDEMSVAM